MARYIRKLRLLSSLGPSEERGAGLWAGYELQGVEDDLSDAGLIRVDDWTPEELARHGVRVFTVVAEDDEMMRRKLGIGRPQ